MIATIDLEREVDLPILKLGQWVSVYTCDEVE